MRHATDYEMYTEEGNLAVAEAVRALLKTLGATNIDMLNRKLPRFKRERRAYELVREMQRELVADGFTEVHDTEPEWDIADALTPFWEEHFGHRCDRWEF
jgi:hypothetical protein